MVEPVTSSSLVATKAALATTREATRLAGREVLSKGLEAASSETQGAVRTQLRRTFLSEAGRPDTAVEKAVHRHVEHGYSRNLVDGKRIGMEGELRTRAYLGKAEKRGVIRDVQTQPMVGKRLLDFQYEAARDLRIPEKLTGTRWRINAGDLVAHEQKCGSPEYLMQQLRGRLRDQVMEGLRAKRHVIVTIDKSTLAEPRVRDAILHFKREMAPIAQAHDKALIFTSRF